MINHDLVISHLSLADALAWKKKRVLRFISFDDLQAAAYYGLCLAAIKHNPEISPFAVYAKIRIEGAILDFVRQIYKKHHSSLDAEDQNGQMLKESIPQRSGLQESLIGIAEGLDDNYKKIVFMYYLDGLSLKEISVKLGVVESRVSQLLSKCRKQMREDYVQMVV
jgi:RNA polymerase sigma factor (sigma-70 family)